MSSLTSQLTNVISVELDQSGRGTVSKQELKNVLCRLRDWKEGEVDALLEAAGCTGPAIDYQRFVSWLMDSSVSRQLSLPKAVVSVGGVEDWNRKHLSLRCTSRMLDGMCKAETVDEALREVRTVISLGRELFAYAYMRKLYSRNPDLFYATLMAQPAELLPVVYTPTVGEACQKFGTLPLYSRGCYLSISDRGCLKQVLQEYAELELSKDAEGHFLCDCIVFSDGGRILGLGDLGAWGMGIPIGKLDLYTVCAGVDPRRTIPVIIDAGCHGPEGNSDKLEIRDHELYTGLRRPRVTHKSDAGTMVNSAYYGENSMIKEFMDAAKELFGKACLLQFEDFNSNDAFPLLAEYRTKYLSYNDDIQGTAAVAVAALLGAMRLREPSCKDLKSRLQQERFLFHGAGSANIGVMRLLRDEAGVPASSIFVTNSRGLIWCSEDGSEGSFRNEEQKAFAQKGRPSFDSRDLVALVEHVRPSCIVGAVGVAPNCFTKPVVEALLEFNTQRPVIFALSNPKTKAEITAQDAYEWSDGRIIYGSGTWFPPVEVGGRVHAAGQVNNVYIFPGVSFGAVCCQANTIPERFFMVAAEAVASSLDEEDIAADMVVPRRDRIRDVSLEVAAAVVLDAQATGLAGRLLGDNLTEVKEALAKLRWSPNLP